MQDGAAVRGRARLIDLATAHLVISLNSFGGGLALWARRILVERRRWLDDNEFLSGLALCQVMPGGNVINLSVYVGGRLRGVAGALAALAGLLLVPFAVILGFGVIYAEHHGPAMHAVLRGVAAAAIAMNLALGLRTIARYRRDPGAVALTLAATGALMLHVPILAVVGVLGPLGVAHAWARQRREGRAP